MSEGDWSAKPRLIGDLERIEHFHLEPTDRCLFFGEYTSHKGFDYGETNQLIRNLQKPVSLAGTAQYRHKHIAITRIAAAIRAASTMAANGEVTIVPAPPSKPRCHPAYDDRMERIAKAVSPNADVRCLLETTMERRQAKRSEQRPTIDALAASMRAVETLLAVKPKGVILLDDVITSGTTFKAAQRLLGPYLDGVKFVGLFVARRVFAPIEWPEQ